MSTPESETAGPLTCSICKRSSRWHEAFKRVKDGTISLLCCPKCAPRKTAKLTRLGLGALALCVILGVANVATAKSRGMDFFVVAYALFWLFGLLLVPFHELGHVVAARLVGARPYAVCVGYEPWYVDRTWLGIRWRLGLSMTGGLTYHGPCEGPRERLRYIVILSGGVAVNLLVAIVAGLVAMSYARSPDEPLVMIACFSLAAASAYQFVANLWPRKFRTTIGLLETDGARILALLRGAPTDRHLFRAAMHYMQATFAFGDRDFETARRESALAESLWEGEADEKRAAREAMIIMRAAACSESDRAAEAVALLQPLHEAPSENLGIRSGVEDNLAWAWLLIDEPGLIERALPLIESACTIAPWNASYVIAHACLLAASATPANGRLDAARRVMESLRGDVLDRQNAMYAELARGLCAAGEGDAAAARRYFESAKSLGATAAPLRVLERRIPN